jgi:hypothetical protein
VDKNPTYSFWGGYHGLLGGISRTFGGDITDFWGGYHGLLGGISRTFLKKKSKQISLLVEKKNDLAKS